MSPSRPAVLVVNYGSHALVEDNLGRTRMREGTFVVVVDNFSSDHERERISVLAEREGWELLRPSENLGFGAGMNLAAAHAVERGATSLVLLNPDAHLIGDGVAALAAHVEADPSVVVSPVVERPDGRHFASEMELDLDTGEVRRVRDGRRYDNSASWLSGACLAISPSLWRRIDGFDDDYFLYWEDIDLSVRAERAGARLVVDPGIRAVHSAGGTQVEHAEQRGKSPTYYYYNVRNRLVFAAQHLDAASQRRWRRRSLGAAWSILMRGGRRQLLHPSRTILPAWRGTRAGLTYMRRRAAGTERR